MKSTILRWACPAALAALGLTACKTNDAKVARSDMDQPASTDIDVESAEITVVEPDGTVEDETVVGEVTTGAAGERSGAAAVAQGDEIAAAAHRMIGGSGMTRGGASNIRDWSAAR